MKFCLSSQFLQLQKNRIKEPQECLERYCIVLPVVGFNRANSDLNLIKSHLLPIHVNERDIEPTVIRKSNQFIFFKIGEVHFFDIMIFLPGGTSPDFCLSAYKTSETKAFFRFDKFHHPDE